jgi:hypothetical protein
LGDCLHWAYENDKSSPIFGATLFHSLCCVLFFAKNGSGYILGEFSQTRLVTLVESSKFSSTEALMFNWNLFDGDEGRAHILSAYALYG